MGLALSSITVSPSFAIKRYEEETEARGCLFPEKPICRSRQTGSRAAAMPGRGLVLRLLMLGQERLNVHQQERPLLAHSGPLTELSAGPLLVD
jgi:hypothetical protein